MSHLIIKKSTPDSEIASKLTPEEILGRFVGAKTHSNRWDAERDKLRQFIQDHIEPGRYGAFILDKTEGTPRVYVNSEGSRIVQEGCLIDVGIIPYPKGVKPGTIVLVVEEATGETVRRGMVIDNKTCYSKKPPTNINITEIPNEDEI